MLLSSSSQSWERACSYAEQLMQPLLSFLYQVPVTIEACPQQQDEQVLARIEFRAASASLWVSPWSARYTPTTSSYFSLLARVASYLTKHPRAFAGYRLSHKLEELNAPKQRLGLHVSDIAGKHLGFWQIQLCASDEAMLALPIATQTSHHVEWCRLSLIAQIGADCTSAHSDCRYFLDTGNQMFVVEVTPNAIHIVKEVKEQNMEPSEYVPLRIVLGHLEVKRQEFLSLREGSCLQSELPEQFDVDIQIGERSWCTARASFAAGKLQLELTQWAENIFKKKTISDATTNENLRLNEKLSDLEDAA